MRSMPIRVAIAGYDRRLGGGGHLGGLREKSRGESRTGCTEPASGGILFAYRRGKLTRGQ